MGQTTSTSTGDQEADGHSSRVAGGNQTKRKDLRLPLSALQNQVCLRSTALHAAVRQNEAAKIPVLAWQGIDLNGRNEAGNTAVHLAVEFGLPEALAELLSLRPNLDLQNRDGKTALHIAAVPGFKREERTAMLQALLNANAAISIPDQIGRTALHVAAANGNLQAVKKLCTKGARRTSTDKDGYRPMDLAQKHGHDHVVQYFVQFDIGLSLKRIKIYEKFM